ncbi:hypothetical protein [Microbacterium sp. GCS4]|uniref:hypothetical protein n=1 Tax=Microbacterium sp. GCS4 TaxID=1692239 RepID=UPI000681B9AC|nr:hypothetical protein [Microbacterium sp. GCS4]KNY04148.1 hypothetical protein AKH00_17565 [Microbacterium sp. GCS4]
MKPRRFSQSALPITMLVLAMVVPPSAQPASTLKSDQRSVAGANSTADAAAAALENVEAIEPRLILSTINEAADKPVVGVQVDTGAGAVELPIDPGDALHLTGWSDETLSIHLPYARHAEEAVQLDEGAIVYTGAQSSRDANGAHVPTSYDVSENVLTQVVTHIGSDVAYPVVADPIFLAPWVLRCLLGLGLNGPQIVAAFASGTIWGGLGRAALACALGK